MATALRDRIASIVKMAGGYVMIPEAEILAVAGPGAGIAKIRTWLATREIHARRIAGGYPAPDAATFIREISRMGIRGWRSVIESIDKIPAMAGRMVPIPRRLIRWIIDGAGRVEAVTALAIACRCLFVRGRRLNMAGAVSLEWIATTFGVSRRAAATARGKLAAIGWIRRVDTPRWHSQRYGGAFEIAIDCEFCTTTTATNRNNCTTIKPEPLRDNQQQPRRRPADGRRRSRLVVACVEFSEEERTIDGICREHARQGGGRIDLARVAIDAERRIGRYVGPQDVAGLLRKKEAWHRRRGRPESMPTAGKITAKHLGDAAAVGRLYLDAVARGWCEDSEASAVRAFVAAAKSSRLIRSGEATPALWVWSVRTGDGRASGSDIVNGQRMLKAWREKTS